MKLTTKSVVATIFIGIIVSGSASAADWGTSSLSEHTTNNLYQLLFGYVDMCQRYSSPEAVEIRVEARKFIKSQPELIKALTESPYFASAKRKMDVDIESKTEFAKDSCQAELATLKQINNPKFEEGKAQEMGRLIVDLKGP